MFTEGMKFSKKSIFVVIVLTFVSTYLTLYTWNAHTVAAGHIHEDPEGKGVDWGATSGSLFPWPRGSGMLPVLVKLNEVDLFIYSYLIKTWGLVGISILMWIGTVLSIFRLIKAQASKC